MEVEYLPVEKKFLILDGANPDYELAIEPGCSKSFRDVKFLIYSKKSPHVHSENGPFVLVTARDFEDYNEKIINHTIDPRLQYLEVGPGLGGFLERIVSMQDSSCPKPIAIEQADYSVMKKMLKFAKAELSSSVDQKTKGRIETLIERCNLIANSDKIRLIQRPMQNATTLYPELVGCADRVVSNVAVGHYAMERREYFQEILESFLKPNGKLLQFEGI